MNFFGTSGRRCSQSPLGGQLVTTLVDRYFHHSFLFFSFSLFFLFLVFSVVYVSHRRSARINNLFSKSWQERLKTLGRPLSRPRRLFWGPLSAILELAGGMALQAVRTLPPATVSCLFSKVSPFPLTKPLSNKHSCTNQIKRNQTKLNSTQLGTTQLQLVSNLSCSHFRIVLTNKSSF